MKPSSIPELPACHPPKLEPDRTCQECGAFGAYLFADAALCPECYVGKGSCCPEFGKDDLWRQQFGK